jgi:cysteine desulfurase family protein (TIGR01976 family)
MSTGKPTLADVFARQRREFPGLGTDRVHLNNAAGAEMPEAAIVAMADFMRARYSNEGRVFERQLQSVDLAREAHEATADLLGASPDEVAITPSTSVGVSMISRALGKELRPGDRIFVSEACHESHLAPWLACAEAGVEVALVPMLEDTRPDYAWLEEHADDRTRLIAIGASSNVTGTIHDVDRVVRLARKVGALVSVDAAHFAAHRPIDIASLDVDLLFLSGYKCFGPHLGACYIRRSLVERLVPHGVYSWRPFASRFELGSRNLEGFAGWLGALEYLARLGRSTMQPVERAGATRRASLVAALRVIQEWEAELTAHADARLLEIPGLELYRQPSTDTRARLGVFSFNIEGREPLEVARALDAAGIEAALGHNGAVRTMAKCAPDFGGISVRLSVAHYTTMEEIDRAVDTLASRSVRGR